MPGTHIRPVLLISYICSMFETTRSLGGWTSNKPKHTTRNKQWREGGREGEVETERISTSPWRAYCRGIGFGGDSGQAQFLRPTYTTPASADTGVLHPIDLQESEQSYCTYKGAGNIPVTR